MSDSIFSTGSSDSKKEESDHDQRSKIKDQRSKEKGSEQYKGRGTTPNTMQKKNTTARMIRWRRETSGNAEERRGDQLPKVTRWRSHKPYEGVRTIATAEMQNANG